MTTPSRGPEERNFSDPLRATQAATVMLDEQGRVTGWSREAEALLGYRAQEVLGQSIDTLSARTDGDRTGEWLTQLSNSEHFHHVTLRHRSGRRLRVAAAFCRLPDTVEGPTVLLSLEDAEEFKDRQMQQAMVHGIATQATVALTIYGTDLRVAWANTAARQELPGPFAQYLGRSKDELYPGSQMLSAQHPSSVTQLMSSVLDTGQSVRGLHYRGRPLPIPAESMCGRCPTTGYRTRRVGLWGCARSRWTSPTYTRRNAAWPC